MQSLVALPYPCAWHKSDGREKMHVHVAQPLSMKPVELDECQHLVGIRSRSYWEIAQQFQYQRAVSKAATGDLADDEGGG